MRLLIDANIILDVLQKREGYWKDSSLVWKLCETEQAKGHVSALSFANLVDVMRKEFNAEQIHDVLKKLQLIFRFEDFIAADLEKAAEMKWDDYEDAIQVATAERIEADHIVTRNVRDFKRSKIIAFTPGELIARI